MNKIEITSLEDERLDIYTKYNEAQLLHYFEPEIGVFICETPMVIERALDRGCQPLSFLVEEKAYESEAVEKLFARMDEEIDVFVAPLEVINSLTGFNLTRGVLAIMRRVEDVSASRLLSDSKRVAVLEDVVNPTNVGAIFRSAAALGIDGVLLTKPCSDPFYRRAARVSMGTVFQIPWAYIDEKESINSLLHQNNFKSCAMALKDNAISVSDPVLKEADKLAIILGTEAFGIKDETLEECDYTVIIPMSAGVDSLNVAAASAVAFWELASKQY